ncbi:MAG: alpha/beta hydrolase [Desulfobulbaceae bacterium]|nr:alpha/beta hydrolase [Desulfobulbaceae bacterium]
MIDQKESFGQCKIHYIETDSPAGQDVVLLHGMKFQAATWKELGTLATLDDAGKHAIALDLPGFGGSPDCDVNPDQVLVDFITQKKLEKPVVIGPSMGGRLTIEFCLDHPELVGGLVLVGAVGVQENKARLARINVPTLIVWGGEDAISPIENGKTLHELIKGSAYHVINGAPHPCYLEQPDEWHRVLLSFLENI